MESFCTAVLVFVGLVMAYVPVEMWVNKRRDRRGLMRGFQ